MIQRAEIDAKRKAYVDVVRHWESFASDVQKHPSGINQLINPIVASAAAYMYPYPTVQVPNTVIVDWYRYRFLDGELQYISDRDKTDTWTRVPCCPSPRVLKGLIPIINKPTVAEEVQ